MVTMFFQFFIGQALRSCLLRARNFSEHFTYCHILFLLGRQTLESKMGAQVVEEGRGRVLGSSPGKGRDRKQDWEGVRQPHGKLCRVVLQSCLSGDRDARPLHPYVDQLLMQATPGRRRDLGRFSVAEAVPQEG